MLAQELGEQRCALAALDITIHLIENGINPLKTRKRKPQVKALPPLRAFPKEYGRRGALKEFIVSTLKDSPDGITMRVLSGLTANHFGIVLTAKAEVALFVNHSVKPQVKLLKKQGFAEVRYGLERTQSCGRWYWKKQLPSLAELADLAAPDR